MEELRLYCHLFRVDVCIRCIDGHWIASADTPDGRTIGIGMTRDGAPHAALAYLRDVRDELLGTVTMESS